MSKSSPESSDSVENSEKAGSKVLRPDDVIDQIGIRNCRLLTAICLCSLAWGIGAIALMTSAFISIDCGTCNDTMQTIVSEFDLHGDRSYLIDLSTSAIMIGNMIGGAIMPLAADRFGRRPIMMMSFAAHAICAILVAISPNIYVFSVFRVIQGAAYMGGSVTSWVWGYELSPILFRQYTTLLYGLTWVVGYCLVAPMAYFSPSWRILIGVCAIPLAVYVVLLYCFVPETLHYLVSRKLVEKAENWIRKISSTVSENCDVSNMISTKEEQSEQKKASVIRELLKNKKLILYMVILVYIGTCDNFFYFGLSLFSTQLSGNHYVNYLLMGVVELPAYVATPFLLDRLGRKPFVAGTHLLAGVCFFALLAIPDGHWGALVCWFTAKFAVTGAFMSLFVYSVEITPTNIRNAALGFCSVLARTGAVLSPYIRQLSVISPILPAIVLGTMSTGAGLLTLLLPETRRKPLPSSMGDKVDDRTEKEPTAKIVSGSVTSRSMQTSSSRRSARA